MMLNKTRLGIVIMVFLLVNVSLLTVLKGQSNPDTIMAGVLANIGKIKDMEANYITLVSSPMIGEPIEQKGKIYLKGTTYRKIIQLLPQKMTMISTPEENIQIDQTGKITRQPVSSATAQLDWQRNLDTEKLKELFQLTLESETAEIYEIKARPRAGAFESAQKMFTDMRFIVDRKSALLKSVLVYKDGTCILTVNMSYTSIGGINVVEKTTSKVAISGVGQAKNQTLTMETSQTYSNIKVNQGMGNAVFEIGG